MKSTIGRLSLLFVGVIALSGLALVACGGDDDDDGEGSTAPTATVPAASNPTSAPASSPTAAAAPEGAVEMTMVDFGYQPGTIEATAGQPVRIQLTNSGQQPHTFTIDDVVDSGDMDENESQLVEFTPAQAGTLTFYCTVHGQAAMSGEVNVAAP